MHISTNERIVSGGIPTNESAELCRDLQHNVGDDDEKGEGEVDEEPDLHRFDSESAGKAGGDWQVDRGQDHHAGDVDGDDQVGLALHPQVVGGLVDDVHQDGGQVGDQEHVKHIRTKINGDF